MPNTLFIVNPNAGSGRGRKTWHQVEPKLHDLAQEYTVMMTHHPDDVDDCIAQAAVEGVERVISIGGDGTTNVVVNALMAHNLTHPDHQFIYGAIPAGTGRDFARGAGLPLDTLNAADYILKQASVQPIDVGQVEFGGLRRYFLNISSAGISHDVVQRVERANKRPWTFFVSIVAALAHYQPEAMRIELDGALWFEGRIYIAAVANGTTFGQGIIAAPDAVLDDGLFDVVVAEEMATWDLIKVVAASYRGKHIHYPQVQVGRAKQVRILSPTQTPIGMDLDGEPAQSATEIRYQILPGALQMLL